MFYSNATKRLRTKRKRQTLPSMVDFGLLGLRWTDIVLGGAGHPLHPNTPDTFKETFKARLRDLSEQHR